MLPILHAIQEEFGFISEAAMRLVAQTLNVSRAEVYGVVTFYHDFRQEPAGQPCAENLPGGGLPVRWAGRHKRRRCWNGSASNGAARHRMAG